ncbi:hypothetical protein EDC01DRAFT_136286 [Geopyxis carbonaria]|nr:hypothetical protein EDC01DRAFT_136286 [Geopyxis carbonaria]
MLNPPRSRAQDQRRPEHSILQAKPDPKRRVQRSTPPPRHIMPGTPRSTNRQNQGHRRNMSVPDNVLMTIASAPTANIDQNFNVYQMKQMNNFGNGVLNLSSNGQQHHGMATANFYMQPNGRSRTPPTQSLHKFHPITPQSPFPDFAHVQIPEHHQIDASQMIDELLSFEPARSSPDISRRGSSAMVSSPLRTAFGPEALDPTPRSHTFPQTQSKNKPIVSADSAPLPSISPFDLAPLPHPNFVNLAALSMPMDNDSESYYSPRSDLTSPTFGSGSGQSSPDVRQFMFENVMSTVPEEPSMIKVVDLNTDGSAKAVRGRPGRPCAPAVAKDTGISVEEISSFISGPEPSDGKWVCLFPECNKRFGRKENIKSHVQTHLGDRQFRCEVCKKCFVRQHDLKRHAKIHTGIKPYPCLCGNSFARHDALTRHRQRGMCIGAFEGVVKKVAKRGRPRKRPLEEGEVPPPKKASKNKKKDSASSDESSSGSDVSDPRTPGDVLDFGSPAPETPNYENYDSSSSTAARSIKEDSPELVHSMDSPDYTPPTSPPDVYDFEDFMAHNNLNQEKRESTDSSCLPNDFAGPRDIDYSDLGLPPPGSDCKSGSVSSDEYSQSSSTCADEFLFSQDGVDMFGLTALERDPSILGLTAEGIYIKPEMLSS